ncbi:hypothetical protein BGZ67_008920 [Mortierella alpina]|nr:hypothetical protein BGZ67_008920 [Mortierella alpina]
MAANPTVNLRYEQLKKAVNLSFTDKPLQKGAADKAQLFVLSNTYGYFVAGISDGFVFDKLSNLRDAFEQGAPDEDNMFNAATKVVLPENSVRFIRLSADELTVVVALKGGQVLLYNAASLLGNREGAKPEATLSLGAEIRDIRPNPSVDRNGLAAVLFEDKTLKMIQMDGNVVASIDKHKYTAISWSAKGKQIMCGTDTGRLCQIDPAGVLKKEHLPDSENEGNAAVYMVAYSSPADGSVNVCAISREDPSAPKVTKFIELCFPDQDTPYDAKGYIMSPALKAWGDDNKNVMTVTSYAANDISSIGKTSTGEWAELDLDDTGRPLLPDFDGICVGMGLDLTSTKKLPPREEEGPEVPACPVLYMLNENGRLAGYHIIHVQCLKAAQPYPGMVSSIPIPGVATPASSSKPAGPPAKVATTPTIAPAAPTSSKSLFTAPVASKAAFQTTTQTFGSPSTFSNQLRASPASIPPNPVVNRNPSFQQSKPVVSKGSNEMQKILDEKEVPAKISRSKAVDEEPSAPVPKVSTAMDALSRHLEQTYLAMTEELRTLHSHVKETEALVKAREHVFFELDKFRDVIQKRIHTAQNTKSLAESVLTEFVSLRADLIKVTNKKEEIGKLLKARLDPDLHQMVMASELNPAQLSKQEHMKKFFEIVDGRLRELEDYVESLNAKASKMRQGHDADGPTLDSIRRTIRNISGTLLSRQADLDQLSDELNQLAISESHNPTADSGARVIPGASTACTKPRKRFDLSTSLSSLPDQRPSTRAKEDVAFLLRRVFTSNKQAQPLLTDLGKSTQDKALSVLPRVEATDFVPAIEPRRLETKKQLSAATPAQTEASTIGSATGFAPPPAPFAISTPAATPLAPTQQTAQMSSFGSSPAPPSFSAPQPMFSFAKPTASPASTTGSPFFSSSASTAPAQQAFGTSPVNKQAGFTGFNVSAPTSTPAPTATAAPSWGVPKPAGEAPKAFTGFQLPNATAPALAASTQPSLVTPPSTEQPSKWKEAEDARNGEEDEDDDNDRFEQEEGEEEEEEYQEEYANEEEGDADDVEYDQNYAGKGRYEHDGQTYDLGEGSETDTWGSEADQRDYDDVGGEYEDEDGQDEEQEEEHEEPEGDEKATEADEFNDQSAAAIKDEPKTPSKSAWAAPGFSFPATGPKGVEPTSTMASSESSKPAFSFFTAASKNAKEPEAASKTQSAFGTASSSNTFGSTASFAFGAPSVAASSASPFASKSLFGASKGQDASKGSDSVVKAASPSAFTTVTRAQAQQEHDSDENDRSSVEGEHNSDAEDELGRFEDRHDGPSEDEQEEADDDGDDSDKESALTAIQVGRSGATSQRSDENRRSSTSSRESFSLVEKTSQLEESDLDLSKAGLGSRPRDVTSLSSSFGTVAADSASETLASDMKAAVKVVDAPFVKPQRRRKESRDSLDSNTTDEEDNAASDNDDSPVQRGRNTIPAPLSGFGSLNTKAATAGFFEAPFVKPPRRRKESRDSMDSNTTAEEDSSGSDKDDSPAPRLRDTTPGPLSGFGSLETKDNAGALDSFSLSLGGGDQGEKPKSTTSAWGSTSTSSSWANVSQTSAPTVGWRSTAGFGVSDAVTAAVPTSGAATTSAFTSQPSTLTSAPTSWASGGSAFGQTSTLGSGFGQTSTPGSGFGQTSAPGSGFAQTSTAGTGFGQTSTPGTGFGQTSTPGTGFGQTSTLGTGFGQTSTPGTAFGQTSTSGAGFGQTSTLGSGFGQTSIASSGFGQTSSLGGGGTAFGQTPGGGSAFGQTAQLGGSAFGQTAFGQPSQISGGFGKPQASAFASAATQSNFSNFASSNTNAFAALAQSGTNVLDQSASQGGGFGDSGSGGSAFGTGGGFGGDSASSVFGTGGGFGGSNTTTSGFGGGSAFGGSTTSGSSGFGTGGGFGAAKGGMGSGQSVFGSANQQQSGGFGQPAQQQQGGFGQPAQQQGGFGQPAQQQGGFVQPAQQQQGGFGAGAGAGAGAGFGNVDRSKPSFSGFR